MWTVRELGQFRNALQPYPITVRVALLVVHAGGTVFRSEEQAWDAAEQWTQSGSTGIPDGIFINMPNLNLPLFCPVFSGDLLAA
jgi:hypothetical protein